MERQSGSTTRLDGGSTKIPPHIPGWDHGVGGGKEASPKMNVAAREGEMWSFLPRKPSGRMWAGDGGEGTPPSQPHAGKWGMGCARCPQKGCGEPAGHPLTPNSHCGEPGGGADPQKDPPHTAMRGKPHRPHLPYRRGHPQEGNRVPRHPNNNTEPSEIGVSAPPFSPQKIRGRGQLPPQN